MISQSVITCLENHSAKYPMLQENIDRIAVNYKERYTFITHQISIDYGISFQMHYLNIHINQCLMRELI